MENDDESAKYSQTIEGTVAMLRDKKIGGGSVRVKEQQSTRDVTGSGVQWVSGAATLFEKQPFGGDIYIIFIFYYNYYNFTCW